MKYINHKSWKGDQVSYKTLHQWVRKWLPKPSICQKCNIREPKEVANISGKYMRELTDYLWLCVLCHRTMDGKVAWFIKNRPNFKMVGHLKGKTMPQTTKEKISETMREIVKIRKRNE